MAFQPGDLNITISPSNTSTGILSCVVGKESTFKVKFKNLSPTDVIYNLGVTLSFPNGISFVGSSIIPTSNIIDPSNKNLVGFVNILDLYPNQVEYELDVTIKVDEYYRGTGLPISYGSILSGLQIGAIGDSKPRGSYDSGNTTVESTSTTTVTSLRFATKIIYPASYLKGAGVTTGDIVDATEIFNISIQLINSTRDSSNITLNIPLANGLRYIGVWSTSGTNAVNFNNPLITPVSSTQNFVKINFNNKTLSAGSETTLTFQVAIWDKYTQSGIENSNPVILTNDLLTSSVLMTGNLVSYSETFSIAALEIDISLSTLSIYTDISVVNEYTLGYQIGEYLSLDDGVLTYTIPDGMLYVANSSTLTPTNISGPTSGVTVLTWSIGTLTASLKDSIILSTITQTTYSNTNPVYATDDLTCNLTLNCIRPSDSEPLTKSLTNTLTIVSPIISTNVEGYYYSDRVQKTFDIAAVGDYVRINVIYDATTVGAIQKNVFIFDYPPLITDVTASTDLVFTGDYPPETTFVILPDNGIRLDFGNLDPGIYFEIQVSFPVSVALEDTTMYNLAKCTLSNTNNVVTSLRDSALMYFGIPHITIDESVSSSKCLALNDVLTYEIVINNLLDADINYIVDSFNLNVTANIPSIFSITSPPEVTGTAISGSVTLTGNDIALTILKLSPGDTLTITTGVTITTLPIMGYDYSYTSATTNGTSQQDINSYHYVYNEYPLNDTLTLKGCTPTITKVYTPSTIKLNDTYKATVTVVFPAGGIAYNTKIKDSLVSTNSANLNNLTLNGSVPFYTVTTNNLNIPLLDTIDTTTGPITYTLEYYDKIITVTPVNYQQVSTTTASTDWSEALALPESLLKTTTATLTITVPAVTVEKLQRNVTLNLNYDTGSMPCEVGNIINYKLHLTNIGKSTGYDVIVSDTIPSNLKYLSNDSSGSYNASTKQLSVTVPTIAVNEVKDIVIVVQVVNDSTNIVADNTASLSFKANSTLQTIYGTYTSNHATIYNDSTVLVKTQKNITTGDAYTVSPIRCFINQSISYKVTLTNSFPTAINNIVITDGFPSILTFTSFDQSPGVTLSRNGNVITATMATLAPNATIEFSYTLTLGSNALSRDSSIASMTYNFPDSINTETETSNRVFIVFSDLGRGYKIY